MAQSCNLATGGQGNLDGVGHLGLLTWLGLDWLVSLLGLKHRQSRICVRETGPDHKELWYCIAKGLHNQMWPEDYKVKLLFQIRPRRYDNSDQQQTVSCLPQWRHTLQAINWQYKMWSEEKENGRLTLK